MNRCYTNDDGDVAENIRMTAVQKQTYLKVLLGSISTFAPVISNKFITDQATSINEIFEKLRGHYGFRSTGGRMLELAQFTLGANESYETLWERMSGFVDDNLLKQGSEILHLSNKNTTNELPSPMVQNMLVVLRLKTINTALPTMIKQRFSTQLRLSTVFSLRDDISEAIPSVLAEMQDREYSVNLAKGFNRYKPRKSNYNSSSRRRCCLCEALNRPDAKSHFLSSCPYLPMEDKKYISKSREVVAVSDSDDDDDDSPQGYASAVYSKDPTSSRVGVLPSPVLEVSVQGIDADIILDSGAEIDMMNSEECERLNIEILPTTQKASMADGSSPLQVLGEAHFQCKRGHHTLNFNGLVVKKLNCPILAGMPFLVANDVYVRPKEGSIYLGDCYRIKNKTMKPTGAARTCKATVLRVPHKVCLLPGEEVSVPVPTEFQKEVVAVEPRVSPSSQAVPNWLDCQIITTSSEGEIMLKNSSDQPVLLKKDEQVAQVRHVEEISETARVDAPKVKAFSNPVNKPLSDAVVVDPSEVLTDSERQQFREANLEFDDIFSPKLGCYNGKSGPFSHVITMGPSLPPQRRGRIPMYNRSNLELLQEKYDELLSQGVFAKPEDIGINAEYVNPSFLIKKSDGGHRLVTSFNEIGQHTRPQPSVMPNVDETLRQIA